MVNTIQEINKKTKEIVLLQTSAGGISISIRYFSPGNTGLVIDMSMRSKTITANDMAKIIDFSRSYNASSIILVTDAKINFNPNSIFSDCWFCHLPTECYSIEKNGFLALGYDDLRDNCYEVTSFADLARRCWHDSDSDFYSSFDN